MTDAEKIRLLEDRTKAADGVIDAMRDEAIRLQARIAGLVEENKRLRAACQAVLDEFPALDHKRIESVKSICRAALAAAI